MQELFTVLRGAGAGVLLLLVLFLLVRPGKSLARRLLLMLLAGVIGYVLAPLSSGVFRVVCVFFADLIPGLFLLLVQTVFEDRRNLSRLSLAIVLISFVPGYVDFILHFTGALTVRESSDPSTWILYYLPQSLKIGILLWALTIVARDWRADLVEVRRRARMLILLVVGAYMVIVAWVELLLLDGPVPLVVETIHSAGIVLINLGFGTFLFLLQPGEFEPLPEEDAGQSTPIPEPSVAEQQALQLLRTAMDEDHAYRDLELTIRSLGDRIDVPEHRLRRLINQHLGYRNFNAYLNAYRIREAATRLRDPENSHLPIITIAIESGYRSLTTFNKAFREIQGSTPSEFRQNS